MFRTLPVALTLAGRGVEPVLFPSQALVSVFFLAHAGAGVLFERLVRLAVLKGVRKSRNWQNFFFFFLKLKE